MPMGRLATPPEQRFWPKVDRSGGPDACWPWMARRDADGYGDFRFDPKKPTGKAHRAAWQLTHGPIPDGMSVCHTCDNPPCCNPAHLWLGTNAENLADRNRKGRQARGKRSGRYTMPERTARGERAGLRVHPERAPRGERNSHARLNAQTVLDIRRLHQEGQSYRVLAQHFAVVPSAIAKIITRATWKHI